jgi:hypothetical protein
MSLRSYSFAPGNLDEVERSLRARGFATERRDAPGKFGSLRSNDGRKSAVILDVTEKKDSVPQFAVGSGRTGFFGMFFLWPLDIPYVRLVEEVFVSHGAILVYPLPEKPNQSPEPMPLKRHGSP